MRMSGRAEEIARAIFESERRSRAAASARPFEEKVSDLVSLQRLANVVLRAAGRGERPVWPMPRGSAGD
jgi:hypothetical protein